MRLAIGILAFGLLTVATVEAARAAPCFPGKRTVRLRDGRWKVVETVDAHGEPTGLRGTWGTCTVRRGVVRERDGTKVATVSCGSSIHAPGIVDDAGVSVGMKGEEVLARLGDGPSSTMVCAQYYEPSLNRTRCMIPPPRDRPDDPVWAYDMRGVLPAGAAGEDGFAHGEKALAFFRTRRVLAMFNRGMCH
jgi:hypothetical protein